jgi:hypothetical protein
MRMKKKEYLRLLRNKLLIGIAAISLFSCDGFNLRSVQQDAENPVVATLGKYSLHRSDLPVHKASTSKADSARLAERYVQNWVKKQLMIQEAEKSRTYDEAELNRKLLDYKYALMVYEYEKDYIDRHLEKYVSDQEILAYYDQNRENFMLKEIIVRLNFLKLEKELTQNSTIEKLLKSKGGQLDEIKELAQRYASNHFLEDSTWVRFDEIIVNTPLQAHANKVQLLRQNNLIKVDDEIYSYYFKVLEYKLEDQVPPMEFVKDEISKILINKRRVSLAEELQKNIYNRALEKNEFKIYELH